MKKILLVFFFFSCQAPVFITNNGAHFFEKDVLTCELKKSVFDMLEEETIKIYMKEHNIKNDKILRETINNISVTIQHNAIETKTGLAIGLYTIDNSDILLTEYCCNFQTAYSHELIHLFDDKINHFIDWNHESRIWSVEDVFRNEVSDNFCSQFAYNKF